MDTMATLEAYRNNLIFVTIYHFESDSEKVIACVDAKQVAAAIIVNNVQSDNIVNSDCYPLSDGFMKIVYRLIQAHYTEAAKNRAIIAQESQLYINDAGTMIVVKGDVVIGYPASYGEAIHMMNKADEA